MRFGYTLLLAGALSLGIGIQANAKYFIPLNVENVPICLLSGWYSLPMGVRKLFSKRMALKSCFWHKALRTTSSN